MWHEKEGSSMGLRKLYDVIDILIILIVVMVLWTYATGKTYQRIHFMYHLLYALFLDISS